MNSINAVLTKLGDLLFAPAAYWSPQVTLVVFSVLCGVAMTFIYRHTSNQTALRAAADRTRVQLLRMKLFRDDLRVVLACQAELLAAIGLRLWHSLTPMAILVAPSVLILAQLALRYEHRPLQPGESVVVGLYLSASGWDKKEDIEIEPSQNVTVETPPLRDAKERAIYWRIRPDSSDIDLLRWRCGHEVIETHLAVSPDGPGVSVVCARHPGPGLWDQLLHPGEFGFSAESPVRGIVVYHRKRSTPIFGIDLPWWLTFLIVAMLTALAVRPVLKVQF